MKTGQTARQEPPEPPASLASDAWLRVEVDTAALRANITEFLRLVRPPARLLAVVKAEGYGHGMVLAARAFLAAGADWLGVHSVDEALRLRQAGFAAPILVLGPATASEAAVARDLSCDLTVSSLHALQTAIAAGGGRLHLKVETGVNRQGFVDDELDEVLRLLADAPSVQLVGLSSHFADIEDTTDHRFARLQQTLFDQWIARLSAAGYGELMHHMSCSAAALLWPQSHRSLVRVGIAAYGIWPSRETQVAAALSDRPAIALKPALSWKVRVAQVRNVPAGDTVGYGRSWLAPVDSRIAVLPVGYSDGYRRSLSGRAHVLIHGRRAPLCGRVCMNLCMADVTRIADAVAGDEAVLLGPQGNDRITVERVADWLDTIAYEVLTLPGATWRRAEAPHA